MAKAIQKITLNQAENIAFDKIELSQKNVRRIKSGVTIEQLAEDIARRGLLQSLNVRPIRNVNGEETGRFDAPAGGRRYKALELLIKQNRLVKMVPTPCIVNRIETTSAEEDSLAENTQREQLHPLDQLRAFKTLSDQGLNVAEVAARFFVTPTFVKQRLKLAAISPKLLGLYEEGEIRIDQLEAFAVSDDHVRQEQVWNTVVRSHVREAYYIRRLLTETAVRATDRRAVYVGIEAYEAAGGVVMRDLFEQDQGGWLRDPALLEQLVFEKLKGDAETLKAEEGWKWVDAAIDFPYGHASGLRRFYAKRSELGTEELARYSEVKAQSDKLAAEYADAEDYSEKTEARLEELGNELDQFNKRPYVFHSEEVARGGAFICLGAGGELKIERGFVLPDDEPVPATYDSNAGGNDHDDKGHKEPPATGGASISGRPVEQPQEEDDKIRPLADRVVEDLTATRTVALRNALANEPSIAFAAALHAFVLKVFYADSPGSCLELAMQTTTFGHIQGLGDTVWEKEIEQRHEAWGHDLPSTPSELWDYLTALDDASQQALFAHCVSLSLNATIQPWNRRSAAIAHAEQLSRTIGFNMIDAGWALTVDNYLGRVSKAHILQAVREAKGEQSAQLIDHLKKHDMARVAVRLLEGSAWLPEPLRQAVDEAHREDRDSAFNIEDGSTERASVQLPGFQTQNVKGDDSPRNPRLDEHSHTDAVE